MIRGLYTAASGMLLGLRQQDVVAENMANSSTVGYKAEQSSQAAFGNVLARSVSAGRGPLSLSSDRIIGNFGTGAYVDKTRTFLAQGSDRLTGSPLDAMVRGNGFFAVQMADGVRYTRDGHFARNDANVLVNAKGHSILDAGGNPITVDTDRVRIKSDGGLYRLVPTAVTNADGSQGREDREEFIAQLQIVDIAAQDLVRAGDTQFATRPGAAIAPIDFTQGGTTVLQGALEEANVAVNETATDMFSLARTFEASQKVFATISESLLAAVKDVGRV
ncbi:MAG: flagellar hook-basal body protein [Dehalococcoidia bacterium]